MPKEWLESRLLGTAGHRGAFVDLGHSDSLAHLRSVLASRVVHYGLDDLDAGAIRRAPRAFTQEISRYVFEHARTATGDPVSGIRYRSRLGDEFVNWAIFESSPPADPGSGAIDLADDALESIFRRFELAWG